MEDPIFEELYAQAIGKQVLKYLLKEGVLDMLAQETESAALRVLSEIQTILNDDEMDDPSCFRRIDAIVNAFHTQGLSTVRHDF